MSNISKKQKVNFDSQFCEGGVQATTEIMNFSGQHSSSTDRQAESEVRVQTLTISDGEEGRIICLDQSTH